MNDQAFPGQPLNDEWLFADPEKLILIQSQAESHEIPTTVTRPGNRNSQPSLRWPRHSWGSGFVLGLSVGIMGAYLAGLLII